MVPLPFDNVGLFFSSIFGGGGGGGMGEDGGIGDGA